MFFCDNYQIQLAPNSIYSRPSDKNVARFHYQDAIYLPCPQSLAMVLGVFKVIIKYQKREKGGNEKGKKDMFCLPITPCSRSFPLFSTEAQDRAMQNPEKSLRTRQSSYYQACDVIHLYSMPFFIGYSL